MTTLGSVSSDDSSIEVLHFKDSNGHELSDHNPVQKELSLTAPNPNDTQTKLDKLSRFFQVLSEENARIYHTWGILSRESRIKSVVMDNVLCQVVAQKYKGKSILDSALQDDQSAEEIIRELLTTKVKVNLRGEVISDEPSSAVHGRTIEVSLLGIISTRRVLRFTKFVDAAARNSQKPLDEIAALGDVTTVLTRLKKTVDLAELASLAEERESLRFE